MNVQINVSGVFLLLRSTAGDSARILIPNSFDRNTHEDDTPAKAHHPFLVEHAQPIAGCELNGKGRHHSLKRQEVVFRFDDTLDPGETPDDPSLDWSGYLGLPLIGVHTFNPRLCVRSGLSPYETGPAARLTTRLTIPAGDVHTCNPDGTATDYELRGRMKSGPITPAGILRFEVENVAAAFIDHRKQPGGAWHTDRLQPLEDGTAYVSIGNLCALSPDHWHTCRDTECSNGVAEDLDFKWIYRLLTPCGLPDWDEMDEEYLSYPVGICPPEPADVDTLKVPKGATTSTCFPGECEDCPD